MTRQCRQSDAGARQVSAILNDTLLPALSETILVRLAGGDPVSSLAVDMGRDGAFSIGFQEQQPALPPQCARALDG